MSAVKEALLAFRTAWSIPDHHARMEALYNASKAAEAALSAEPAQEMTDEQLRSVWNGAVCVHLDDRTIGALELHLRGLRAVIAADRASRLPEMGECDWPALPAPLIHDYNERWDGVPRGYTADQLRAAQVAAVEAYKALCRGEK